MEDVCPVDESHQEVENQYGDYLSVTHPSNINLKYQHLMIINSKEKTGRGIRVTYSYEWKLEPEDLPKKRAEFWETRVEGNKATWEALRFACENTDTATVVEILKAAGIKLIKKTLQMSYDENGYRYDLPIFLINEPSGYYKAPEEQIVTQKEEITLTLRVMSGDHKVTAFTSDSCSVLPVKLKAVNPSFADMNFRFFCAGREMVDSKQIGHFTTTDAVITVFPRKVQPQ